MTISAEFSRVIPRDNFDHELAVIIRDQTTDVNLAIKDLAKATESVQSVAGKTGTVVLTKDDVGLGNVENFSPTSMPVSDAVAYELNRRFKTTEPIPLTVIEGLVDALAARVQYVNGNPPDAAGNVELSFGDTATLMPKPETAAQRDVLTFIETQGWVGRQVPALLEGTGFVVGPTAPTDGGFLRYSATNLAYEEVHDLTASAVILTSPNGTKYQLTVGDDGILQTQVMP